MDMEKHQGRRKPLDVAHEWIGSSKDPPDFRIENYHEKGRGVQTCIDRSKGEFLLEYVGDKITNEEGLQRENKIPSVFRYFYTCKGKKLCIDATEESGRLGRLVNHGERMERNCIMKTVDDALCLFCARDIRAGEEILYDYGVNDLPWKKNKLKRKEAELKKSLETGKKQQQEINCQQEELKRQREEIKRLKDVIEKEKEELERQKHIEMQRLEEARIEENNCIIEQWRQLEEENIKLKAEKEVRRQKAAEKKRHKEQQKQELRLEEAMEEQKQQLEKRKKVAEHEEQGKQELQSPVSQPSTLLDMEDLHTDPWKTTVQNPFADLWDTPLPGPEDDESSHNSINGASSPGSDSGGSTVFYYFPQVNPKPQSTNSSPCIEVYLNSAQLDSGGALSASSQENSGAIPAPLDDDCFTQHKNDSLSLSVSTNDDDANSNTHSVQDLLSVEEGQQLSLDDFQGRAPQDEDLYQPSKTECKYIFRERKLVSSEELDRSDGESEIICCSDSGSDYEPSDDDESSQGSKGGGSSQTSESGVSTVFVYLQQLNSEPKNINSSPSTEVCPSSVQSDVGALSASSLEESGAIPGPLDNDCFPQNKDDDDDGDANSNNVSVQDLQSIEEDQLNKSDTRMGDFKQRRRKYFKDITVATYQRNGNHRNYTKADYCLFCCSKYSSKISKHYLAVHVNEEIVQKISKLPLKSRERKVALKKLQNEGNYKHNVKVLQTGRGEIVVCRRPKESEKEKPNAIDYIPCEFCLAFVREDSLWLHVKTCELRTNITDSEKNYVRNGRLMLDPFIIQKECDDDFQNLVSHMKETVQNPGLKDVVEDDILIKEFASSLLDKLGTEEEQRRKDKDNIRTKVRSVARLLQKLNSNKLRPQPLNSYIRGQEFMVVVNTVKQLSIDADSPNLALVLGHYLKQICLLKISLGIRNDDSRMRQEANDFKELHSAHWNSKVSAVANRRLKLRCINKKVEIPSTSDLVKLKAFVDEQIKKGMKIKKPTYEQWVDTAQKVLVRIVLFNKRRIAEVEELTTQDFHQRITGDDAVNEEILESLGIAEKALAKRMQLIEVRGKSTRGLRKVFILLTTDMVEGVNYLLQTRIYAGIDPKNKYVFGRTSLTPQDGCKAMRVVTEACPGLERQNSIRSSLLRKYLATMSQVMDMSGEELKMVADHMGHSVAIHTDVYKLQESTLERTKVARALIALENGTLTKFKGQSLDAINLEDLPKPVVIEPEETDCLTEKPEQEDQAGGLTEEEQRDVGVGSVSTLQENHGSGVKRKRWRVEEEEALAAAFRTNLEEKQNVSNEEIRQGLKNYPALAGRTEPIIRAKINNIILGKDKKFKLL